jgi:hypothetical protein
MPRIVVMSEPSAEGDGVITLAVMMSEPNTPPESAITLDERVTSADLRSGHHSAQLIERVGWAVHDADDVERAEADDPQSARSRTSARRAKALTN